MIIVNVLRTLIKDISNNKSYLQILFQTCRRGYVFILYNLTSKHLNLHDCWAKPKPLCNEHGLRFTALPPLRILAETFLGILTL